ncbi:hypothetical protein KDA23_05335 [Candidatus Saccharibacteria bacterium]|nr:hypothetical protein [Candidatus Saccharibacteria bacterium]
MEILAEQPSQNRYVLADSIPELAEARDIERQLARGILDARKDSEVSQNSTELLPVDALSTADRTLEAGQTYGFDSSQYGEHEQGLVQDCHRLVAEWYRKKRPEYFPELRHEFRPEEQSFFSHGLSIRQMTENALVPIAATPEEEDRRVNERVEDATALMVRGLGAVATGLDTIRTISECTDWAIERFGRDQKTGKHEGYGGYVPEIQKLMIRDIRLDSKTDDRFEEQVGLPGTYITHEILQIALQRRNVEAGHMDKTTLHGSQLLVEDDLMDFVALLDEVATEQWCTNIFMGEEVARGFVKDYAGFRQEALARQASLKDLAKEVAAFVLDLAADKTDRRQALSLVEDFVKIRLLDMSKRDRGLAIDIFDEATADGLRQVAYLESIGQYDEAQQRFNEVAEKAPGGGFCGAGSCGLEAVNPYGEEGKLLASKLRAKTGDTITKDKVRTCKCGSRGSIVYAHNSGKVNKYCTSCGSYESKKTSGVQPAAQESTIAA